MPPILHPTAAVKFLRLFTFQAQRLAQMMVFSANKSPAWKEERAQLSRGDYKQEGMR